jgi:hypothetical protein
MLGLILEVWKLAETIFQKLALHFNLSDLALSAVIFAHGRYIVVYDIFQIMNEVWSYFR